MYRRLGVVLYLIGFFVALSGSVCEFALAGVMVLELSGAGVYYWKFNLKLRLFIPTTDQEHRSTSFACEIRKFWVSFGIYIRMTPASASSVGA